MSISSAVTRLSPGVRPVCYVLGTFPQASQTFVAREIRGLLQLGLPLRIFALRRRDPSILEAADREWFAQVVFVPRALAPSTIGANISMVAAHPRPYWSALRRLVTLPHRPRLFAARAVVLFLRAMWIARTLERSGPLPARIHAHFALAQTEVAMAVSIALGIPFSFTAHARDIYATPSALREKLRAARTVVTCTRYNVTYLRGLCPELPDDRIRLVHHGVPPRPQMETPARTAGHADAQTGRPVILAAGRLVEKKGFDVLLDACARLRDRGLTFECRIAGDGSARAALSARAARLKLDRLVTWLGWMSPERVAAEMSRARVLAVPSVIAPRGDRDGIPNVILEAMAAGLPVVASDVSGVPDAVVTNVTGLLVPPGDAGELADALAALLNDPARTTAMGDAARERAREHFDLNVSSTQLAAVFMEGAPA